MPSGPDIREVWQVETGHHGHTNAYDSVSNVTMTNFFPTEEEALYFARRVRNQYSYVRLSHHWEVLKQEEDSGAQASDQSQE